MTCAIVLAAGQSRRMGRPKLVLPFAGSTVIARTVDAFLEAPVDAVFVVVRPKDPQLRAVLADRQVRFVENPDEAGDMLSSVRCGMRALPAPVKTGLVSPGDQPTLEAALVRKILDHHHGSGRGITVPVHAGRRGHPLIFAARFRDEILTRFDGVGLRGLLDAHAGDVTEWPTDEAAFFEDLNTPEDYRQGCLRQSIERNDVPVPGDKVASRLITRLQFRLEVPSDIVAIRQLESLAFGGTNEAALVDALREAGALALSGVALVDARVVGHVGFSPVSIGEGDVCSVGLALAPIAVHPQWQRQGLGTAFVRWSLDRCRDRNHGLVFVVGHANFYARLGFVPARPLGIECPWPTPDGAFRVVALKRGALAGIRGVVRYHPAFAHMQFAEGR